MGKNALWLMLLVGGMLRFLPLAASDERHCRVYYPKVSIESNDTSGAKRLAFRLLPHLSNFLSGLKFSYQTESPGGFHFAFQQTFCGVPVYQTEVKVNVDRRGVVRSVLDNSYHTEHWTPVHFSPSPDAVIALREGEEQPLLCRLVKSGHKELIYYGEQIIRQHDMRSFITDSLVSGKIFNPDPLTTAQKQYGGLFKDNNDANATWLDNAQQTVNFRAAFNGVIFSLANDYVVIMDFDTPQILPATSTIPVFNFNRSQSGFEDVNVYYHLTNFRQYISALGFNLGDALLWADPHAVNGADNSYFSYGTSPPRIYYGIGGVDDAEDADVIIHEYGHFLSYNAAPQTNFGSQRNALDEGLGDYLAASYSKSISTFNSNSVFNWDGHNEFWTGRVVNTTKKYPTDLTSSIYRNGEIWSTALMNLHDEIGRAATDSLIFETHYNFTANMNMDDAAYLMIEADTSLTGGKYFCPIFKHLYFRGFLPFAANPCGISSVSEPASALVTFTATPNSFSLRANLTDYYINIYAIDGKLVETIHAEQPDIHYISDRLQRGMYIVQVNAAGASQSYRWLKSE